MGRKRKTRWRRLSIGGNSGNEDEEMERECEILGFSKMNPASRHRSGSHPTILNSFQNFDQSSSSSPSSLIPVMNGSGKYSHGESNSKSTEENPTTNGGVNGYSSTHSHKEGQNSTYHHHYNNTRGDHHHNGRGDHHSYSNGYNSHHYSQQQYNGKGNGENGYGNTTNGYGSSDGGSGSGNGYYPSNNYYQHRSSYRGGGSSSSYERGGYRGRGSGSDYHHSSRFGGRFRKPRPYASYYYNNGSSHQQSSDEGTNRPSYNQEEYTKITTPRQDVLFKKGYLSQRKPVTQSGSVDSSTSGPTTPSTNGTPDTHSTNGINSDYSEGYENGETEIRGGIPYDDTVYYGPPPPETAVFTDPNTGQVYYGQSNGEYFDAYPVSPVMVGGYPVYYHMPYATAPGIDWNGIPTQIYPIVPLGPPQTLDEQHSPTNSLQNGETQCTTISQKSDGGKSITSVEEVKSGKKPNSFINNGTLKNSKDGSKVKGGTLSDSSTSSREGSTSTLSSAASTPHSPPINGTLTSLTTSMTSLSLSDPNVQHHITSIHQQGIPPPQPHMPMGHFLSQPPPPPNQSIIYHPHPAAFVYAPPIYNGVVVPIAPAAASTPENTIQNSSPSSRKKRKLRRRKKDDGQLTDESTSEEESTIGGGEDTTPPKDQSPDLTKTNPKTNTLEPPLPSPSQNNSTTSSPLTSPDTSPSKSNNATSKNVLTAGDDQLISTENFLENNKPKLTQIPLDEKEEVRKSEEEEKPRTEKTQENVNSSGESFLAPEGPGSNTELVPLVTNHLRKPQDLTLGGGLETVDLLLLSLKSPDTLEPSSPDSFNTTQSVAGSEVPSVSISETDFMNRTTSVDEVEEDLPHEDFLQESTTIGVVQDSQPAPSPAIDIPSVPSFFNDSHENSPSLDNGNKEEKTPSPETIFERSLEILSSIKTETQKSLSLHLEPTQILSTEVSELVDAVGVETEESECHLVAATVPPLSSISNKIQITQPTEILTQPCSTSPIGRPQSITLAVSEWLKVQGDNALTPVSQLQTICDEDEDESETEEEDSSEEGLSSSTSAAPSTSCSIQ